LELLFRKKIVSELNKN